MVHACCHSEVLLSLEMRMSYHTLCVPFQNLFSDINPVQSHTEGTENDIWCQQQLGRWGQLHAAFRALPQPAAAPHPSQNWKALCKCQCGKKLQKRSNSTGNEAPLTLQVPTTCFYQFGLLLEKEKWKITVNFLLNTDAVEIKNISVSM